MESEVTGEVFEKQDLSFSNSVSYPAVGCNLEGRLIDLMWICETAILIHFLDFNWKDEEMVDDEEMMIVFIVRQR